MIGRQRKRIDQSRGILKGRVAFAATILALCAHMVSSGCVEGTNEVPSVSKPIPPPAWQQGNPQLAAKWMRITGRYIYHQSCSPCHEWGPEYWTRDRWSNYLQDFPDNHEPDVGETYEDLTAMFGEETQVPSEKEQLSALGEFILANAPLVEPMHKQRPRLTGIPTVGVKAPDFTIVDVQGNAFALSQFEGEKSIVLVFSRAHW